MFIHPLQIIRQELNAYLNSIGADSNDEVQLGNISQLDIPAQGDNNNLKNKIVITLVSVKEEKTLKNGPHFRRNDATLKTEYFNPPVFVNLCLLITACQNNYNNALIYLSRIASFFQQNNVFTPHNTTPVTDNVLVPPSERLDDFKITVELYSPSFEELNHVWGTLGGKQLPGLMYLVRIVEIKPQKVDNTRSVIQEIQINAEKMQS